MVLLCMVLPHSLGIDGKCTNTGSSAMDGACDTTTSTATNLYELTSSWALLPKNINKMANPAVLAIE